VCHFFPRTSKWNKVEHRLFLHIAMNWRRTPLLDLATIVSFIGGRGELLPSPRRRCARHITLVKGGTGVEQLGNQ
jgi:hypothetical protein